MCKPQELRDYVTFCFNSTRDSNHIVFFWINATVNAPIISPPTHDYPENSSITFTESAKSDIQFQDPKSPNVANTNLGSYLWEYIDTASQMQGTYTWLDPSSFTSSPSAAFKPPPDD